MKVFIHAWTHDRGLASVILFRFPLPNVTFKTRREKCASTYVDDLECAKVSRFLI